jgi:hypothetical protein
VQIRVNQCVHLKARPAASTGPVKPFAQQGLRYPDPKPLLANTGRPSQEDQLREAILGDGPQDLTALPVMPDQRQ